jgi:hypothetical protein
MGGPSKDPIRCANRCRKEKTSRWIDAKEKTQVDGYFPGDAGKKRNPSRVSVIVKRVGLTSWLCNHLVHFYECLCRGSTCCLRYPFLGTFCIPNPFSCLLIPIITLQVPFTGFNPYSFIFTGIKSCYRCAFSASGQGAITIRGGRAQAGLWLLQLAIIPFLSFFIAVASTSTFNALLLMRELTMAHY